MIRAGDILRAERTFELDEVEAFAKLTGDGGRHHVEPDGDGRLMVHGLLVASVPTGLGGDISYIARTMEFEFLRPVWTGDTVRAELCIERAEPAPGRLDVEMTVVCRNQRGDEVLRGRSLGLIRQPGR